MVPEQYHNTLSTIHQLFIEQLTENNKYSVLSLLHSITQDGEERAHVLESVRKMVEILESDAN